MTPQLQQEIEAATLHRLLAHLRSHPEVQNIELMILADFCRNCLAKWYVAEAAARGVTIDYGEAQTIVYGMPYSDWKAHHQKEATPEQLQAFEERQRRKHAAAENA